MIFVTPTLIDRELEILGQIDRMRARLKFTLQTPMRWMGTLRRNLIARAIQGSNTIEGYHVTYEKAVEVVQGEVVDTDTETRLALEGYRQALTYVLHLSGDTNYSFNEEFVRALHYMMLSYDLERHPGQWRPGPIYVRREPSGERVYEGPDASLVPELMREFVEYVQIADDSIHVVVRAAMAHLNLVMIHPFSDGNGRMGRAVQTIVMTRDGILSPPFSSIEEYLGSRTNTESYYSVLAEVGGGSWQPDRDARPWIRFCLQAHLQQALTVDRRIKEIARLWSDLETEIDRRKLPSRSIYALYDAAIGFRVRSDRYRISAEISGQVAAKDLQVLVKEGFLVPMGEKRGRSYTRSPFLLEMREAAREPRKELPSDIFDGQLKLF
jgi:Fic family protein